MTDNRTTKGGEQRATPGDSGGIPFMITMMQRMQLHQLGHDDATIREMTPEQAQRIILEAAVDPQPAPVGADHRFELPDNAAIVRLKSRRQWVAWKYVKRKGRDKPAKVPVDPSNGYNARVDASFTWGSYEQALACALRLNLDGIGYVLTANDNLTGYDLDKVHDPITGELKPWAAEVVAFNETYCEITPSGEGLRFFSEGKVDHPTKVDAASVEIYGTGRYLTLTGRHVEGTPTDIRPAPNTLAALKARVESMRPAPKDRPPRSPRNPDATQNEWDKIKAAALEKLEDWVPALFPKAERSNQGWRITSHDLGRKLQEDLSFTPDGIRDWGVDDQGTDPNESIGGRTAIDMVMIGLRYQKDPSQFQITEDWFFPNDRKPYSKKEIIRAAQWLCNQLDVEMPQEDDEAWRDEINNIPYDPSLLNGHVLSDILVWPAYLDRNTATTSTWQLNPVDLWGRFYPPELPTGLLPAIIEQYACIEGANMGCDPAGLAMSALTICAGVTSDRIKLQVKKHDGLWTESPRLWTALVGDPSTKKSPIIAQAARPLAKIDSKLVRQYIEAKQRYDALSAEKKLTTPVPKQQRVKIEDTTVEAAQEVLKDSPDGVLLLQDELSGFFGAMDKYSGRGSGADRAFWMKAYNGGAATFHRIARGSGYIPNLSVSMLGGIQPDAIRKTAADGIDDGLLQRDLFIVLRPATVDQDRPRGPAVQKYETLVRKLHKLKPEQEGMATTEPLPDFIREFNGDTGADNIDDEDAREQLDTLLHFCPSAQTIRNQLAEKHITMMASELVNKKLATHIGKYDGVFARLCVLFHCIENIDAKELPRAVSEDTAQRVATFMHEFIFKHAVAFYTGVLGLSDDHDRLRNLAGYILAYGLKEITNRDVQRGDGSMRKLTDFDTLKIFEQLEALGWLERQPPKNRSNTPRWRVNPLVHTLYADRAKQEADRRAAAREVVADIFKEIKP